MLLARTATLDRFVHTANAADGVRVDDLSPMTTLIVDTRNSRYRITVSTDGEIVVQGGRFFPDHTAARLEGSTNGGSVLKAGWICIGLHMELFAGGRRIVTSPVLAIAQRNDSSASNLTH